MAMIITIVNQKGGVGKTTTALNLGAYLAKLGKFTLLVDMDPQANATAGLGVDYNALEAGAYEILLDNTPFKKTLLKTGTEGFKLTPSHPRLAGANVELVNLPRREFRLNDAILEVRNDFDYIIIDTPPSLGLLTVNSLVAADSVLIPVQAEYYALEGLGQLLNTIQLVRENLKPDLEILGAILTMYDQRFRLSNDVLIELYHYFPNKIFRSVIPRNIRLSEAPSHGKTILEYDSASKGAKAYERLAREILEYGRIAQE